MYDSIVSNDFDMTFDLYACVSLTLSFVYFLCSFTNTDITLPAALTPSASHSSLTSLPTTPATPIPASSDTATQIPATTQPHRLGSGESRVDSGGRRRVGSGGHGGKDSQSQHGTHTNLPREYLCYI